MSGRKRYLSKQPTSNDVPAGMDAPQETVMRDGAQGAPELAVEVEALRQRIGLLEASASLGLNWRDIPEEVEGQLVEGVPVLHVDQSLDVVNADPSGPVHALIEGDNLHALHTLQATHKGRIDVIYIDPPYNTGKDFLYNDKLVDRENSWRHSAWLSFMEKRLRLARELLVQGGTLFISIDDNEVARLRLLCDAIFGEKAHIGTFVWERKRKASNLDKSIRGITEYVLAYARGDAKALVHPADPVEDGKPYPFFNSGNARATLTFPPGLRFTSMVDGSYEPRNFSARRTVVALLDNVEIRGGVNLQSFRLSGEWRYSQATLDRLVMAGEEIVFKGEGFKPYLINRDTNRIKRMRTLLTKDTYGVGTNEDATEELSQLIGKTPFEYPKPVSLIEALVVASTRGLPHATILDFFAGSGTTLHAVAKVNASDGGSRRCLLVTNNEGGICQDVAYPRVKAVLTGEWAAGAREPHPGSLRFFQTAFIRRNRNLDQMRLDIAEHTSTLIMLREAALTKESLGEGLYLLQGHRKTIAVAATFDVQHEEACRLAQARTREGDSQIAYLFTWGSQGVEEEIAARWPGWEHHPLPAEMLTELRKLAPPPTLFPQGEGA